MEKEMIVALLLYLFFFPTIASATNSVVIVNQVRGTECCDPGTLENLKKVLDSATNLGLSASYALRYDALQHTQISSAIKEYKNRYPDLVNIGGFLEITPELAKASGVAYSALEKDWYKTTHVYTPGYLPDERTAIIDTYMLAFYDEFGFYPNITVGWFMDTYSLSYLHEKYGVLIHELTREQVGTDSYTLSGGPEHYPYISSNNWSFLPGDSGLTMIRQTITDPEYNYGDQSSSHTSQPNDYGQDKDLTYFKNILDNALNQPGGQDGFVVIGLENSMDTKYQDEYINQLEYLSSKKDLTYPKLHDLEALAKDNRISIYSGGSAHRITTPTYQLRLIVKGDKVMITDFRIYSSEIVDPYNSSKVLNGGYFVAPYLVDGSRWFKYQQSWIASIFAPKFSEGYGVKNDFDTSPSNIKLSNIKKNTSVEVIRNVGEIVINYISSDNKKISLVFKEKSIETTNLKPSDISFINESDGRVPVKQSLTKNEYNLSWFNHEVRVLGINGKCQDLQCNFVPYIDIDAYAKAQKEQSFLMSPTTTHNDDTTGSLVYPSLRYLVLGRSPARVVVIPRSKDGAPVTLSKKVDIDAPGLVAISTDSSSPIDELQIYDFNATDAGKYQVKVEVPGISPVKLDFYFAPNCRSEVLYCLAHPVELYRYGRAIIAGRLQ